MIESYGIYLCHHLDKYQYQDEEVSDIAHATWNFGNYLKSKGYDLVYMHGPVGLFEDNLLKVQSYKFITKDHIKEFDELFPSDFVYFLYQKLENELRYDLLSKDTIKTQRDTRKNTKKALTKKRKQLTII